MPVACSHPTRRVTFPWLLRDVKTFITILVRHATRTSNAMDARKTTTQSSGTTFYKATKISLVYSFLFPPVVCFAGYHASVLRNPSSSILGVGSQ